MKKFPALAFCMAACLCSSAIVDAESDSGLPAPRVIQTQNRAGAVLFWDATAWVQTFASRDTPPAQALKEMEYKALTIFVSRAIPLSRTERHLHMVAAYIRTGAISARYHTKRVEDIQTLFALDGDLHPNMKFPNGWQSRARRGIFPPGIALHVQNSAPGSNS